MILNGLPWRSSTNVEILDLNDQSFSCNNFPKTKMMYGGVVGVVDNTPIVCGGKIGNLSRINYCEKLDMDAKIWKRAVDLKEASFKSGKGSIYVNGSLLISGGLASETLDTIELVSLTASSYAEFNLPLPLFGHCNIQIDDSTVMITG